ncbi:hypothetical protein NESM_000490100 [Novymonas esmeraldas]|uniref:Uncharacterized protein n=1 Tax=Novymonas esmeraldas TaxID=1808958 RepID=A0AAW0EQX7_9TRYP
MMHATDRYTSKSHAIASAGSGGGDDTQNTTAVASSDWSVRPSDDTTVESASVQTNNLSRLNPAAAPFSFTGVGAAAAAAAAAAGGDMGGTGAGGVASPHHPHHHHHPRMMPNPGIDNGVSGLTGGGGGGAGGVGNGGGRGIGGMLNGKPVGGTAGMDVNSPNSYSMIQAQGMMGMMPFMMSPGGGGAAGGGGGGGGGGGHGSAVPRPSSMMDFAQMHGGGGGPAMGVPGGVMGGAGRVSAANPNSFLPPPGEDTDQQELLRLQQTNYRVKMLPPPLTYEVHRKIWSRNEYGDEEEEEDAHGHGGGGGHGGHADAERESSAGGSVANEDPIDKAQRLEAYKQIMQRWYSHIHVLEGKSEVAKRLVRVRRACPSIEEISYSLTHPQLPGTATGSEAGGDDEPTPTSLPPPPPPAALASRRGPDGQPDMEEILVTWSARCWDWWQETVKRKPRRARKQGELPVGGSGATGMPTSASASALATMGDGGGVGGPGLPHTLSARNMDSAETAAPHPPPHMTGGGGGLYTHPTPYANLDGTGAVGRGMTMAPSYKSFTDLSEEGVDGAAAAAAAARPYAQSSPHHNTGSFAPGSHTSTQPPSQPHDTASGASMFTTNGARVAALRGASEDFLENDHLTLAFTTELLKSLEE